MENKLVKFYETELITFVDQLGKPFVAVKTICDAIGLNSNSALRTTETIQFWDLIVRYSTSDRQKSEKRVPDNTH